MPSNLDALAIRRGLLKLDRYWGEPEPFGPDGWRYVNRSARRSCIVSCAEYDGHEWVHASMTANGAVPSYGDLVALHRAVWGDGWAYHVFAPPADHINIHEHCLHLFGRLDGAPVLPDFTRGLGSI